MSSSAEPQRSQYTSDEAEKVLCKDVPQPWRCGDAFQYGLPRPDGDPWGSLLKTLSERDAAQCNAWVDEVQNLLIFAGLFSAVVTAFVVQTYQGLQEDPVVALLAQIAANSAINGSAGVSPPFTPGASTIRLNIFLFLSLILSLSTVLVGIVALQWIREHRQHNNALTPQNTFAALHMRMEALQTWHVPQIFAALPLLLQLALVFFFAGIAQLLVDANTTVLIPIAGVMGATILFLVTTTILPTVQAATLTHLQESIPAPCPYKSPQANAFRQVITSSNTLFRATLLSFSAAYWILRRVVLLPQKTLTQLYCLTVMKTVHHFVSSASCCISRISHILLHPVSLLLRPFRNYKREQWHGFDYMESQVLNYWRLNSWFQFDLAWMSVRDNYFQSLYPPESWLFQHRDQRREYAALYDATQGLSKELTRGNFHRHVNVEFEPALITAYHCALELCAPPTDYFRVEEGDEAVETHFVRNQYLAVMLGLGDITPLRPFSEKLKNASLSVFRDEASFIFLKFIQHHLKDINERSALLTSHYAEIYFRLLGELYSKPYEMNSKAHNEQSLDVAFDGEELYVLEIYDIPDQPFTHQWALSIQAFFSVLGDRQFTQHIIAASFHAHPFFWGYSFNFWRQIKYEIHTQTIQENTINEIINTLSVIHELLAECFTGIDNAEDDLHIRGALIFQSAAVHLWNYKNRDIHSHRISEAAEITMESLRSAQRRVLSFPGRESPVEQNLSIIVERGWSVESWWMELFPKIPRDETLSTVTSCSSSRGELAIEMYDSQLDNIFTTAESKRTRFV